MNTPRLFAPCFVACLIVGLASPALAQQGKTTDGQAVEKKATTTAEKKTAPAARTRPVPGKTAPASAPASQDSRKASGPGYNLEQLVKLAQKTYPGITAAKHAVSIMKHKQFRARWAWVPQGSVKGFVAPSSTVRCIGPQVNGDGTLVMQNGKVKMEYRENNPNNSLCFATDTYDLTTFKWDSIVLKFSAEIGMPLWTFDKIGSAKRAAAAGVDLRQAQLRETRQKLAFNVSRAYWGVKLAQEILYYIEDGRKYLDKGIKQVDGDLEEDKGNYTMQDLQRLKAASAEIDVRVLQAKKMEDIAMAALVTLTGQRGKPFSLDDGLLKVLPGKPQTLAEYRKLILQHRPDVASLKAAVGAAKAARDLEQAKFLPNLLLVASVSGTYAPGVDSTSNGFWDNPYNSVGAGFGLALNWDFDILGQLGKYREARDQHQMALAKKAEALLGMDIELQKIVITLNDSYRRLEITRKQERVASGWLKSITQSMGVGLAKMNDLTDALVSFYSAKLKYLEAIFDVNTGWAELERAVGTRLRARN